MNPSLLQPLRLHRPALAALACGLLLGCGGGGGDDDRAPPLAVPTLSQLDATATSANASRVGDDTAAAVDAVVDATTALALAMPPDVVAGVTLACAGGGSATLGVSGGTLAGEANGQLDAGEHYSVVFDRCGDAAGSGRLDGSVQMDVTAADRGTTPQTLALALDVDRLALARPAGTVTLDGTASAARSVATADGTTTTVSHVTVPEATLATAFNGRSAAFTVSGLDATRTRTTAGGTLVAAQFAGRMTLTGSADGRSLSLTFTAAGMAHDASGALVSGSWTVVRPDATIATTVAGGLVVMTVDDGNDGTIDDSWTLTTHALEATAG